MTTYKIGRFLSYFNKSGQGHIAIREDVIPFYHLTFVLSGTVTYKVNGKKVVLGENDALLLPAGTKRARYKSDLYAHYVIFNFLPLKESEISAPLLMVNAVNSTVRNLLSAYPYTYYRVYDHSEETSPEIAKIPEVMPNLFNCILTELFEALRYKTDNIHILNALKYINENITKPLSLIEVSDAIHLSREYTTRLFKKEMGITLTEYINRQKMLFAKNMLSSDEMSLYEIAYQLGFENYGYFSKVFKSHFGVSPMKMKSDLKED